MRILPKEAGTLPNKWIRGAILGLYYDFISEAGFIKK